MKEFFTVQNKATPHATLIVITFLLCCIQLTSMNSVLAQQAIQIKTFNEELQPLGGIQLAINQGKYIKIPTNGIAFENLSAAQFPVKSISISDKSLEAASWNFSKGVLEITIRKKSYIDTAVIVLDSTGLPLANLNITYKGLKIVSSKTNAEGILNLPLGLNERISSKEQFSIANYNVIALRENAGYQLILSKMPVAQEMKSKAPQEVVKKDWNVYAMEKLPFIEDLTQLYELITQVPRDKISNSTQVLIDEKFNSLLDKLSAGGKYDTSSFINNISDTTIIERDLDNLLKQARQEGDRLSVQRIDFETKIQIVRDKLNVGFDNLDKQDKVNLLADINLLEKILVTNKNEFYENQKSYQAIINELKRRFFDLQELENKLSESEKERLKEKRAYQRTILSVLAVVLVFALLIILLFYLRARLTRQQKELIKANKYVQSLNENLEEIVSERTHLLEKTFKELDLVLYRASHDLRAPICSIAGLSDLLARDTGNNELTDLVLKTNNQMDKLLKKLSTISEIHQPGAFLEVDVKLLSEKVINRFDDQLAYNNITLKLVCESDIVIKSIPFLIEVALLNLIENAIHFTRVKESQEKLITIELSVKSDALIITVEDNGTGIEESIVEHVFDMFFIGTEQSTGNGLGLYIVKKSIDVLKGEITLMSKSEQFTKVVVTLPIDDSHGHTLDFID